MRLTYVRNYRTQRKIKHKGETRPPDQPPPGIQRLHDSNGCIYCSSDTKRPATPSNNTPLQYRVKLLGVSRNPHFNHETKNQSLCTSDQVSHTTYRQRPPCLFASRTKTSSDRYVLTNEINCFVHNTHLSIVSCRITTDRAQIL